MNSDRYESRKRLTKAEAKARTRELLLDAAAHTFAQKGFAGASVDEIAEAAGYTVGALYSNFGSKEGLFVDVMRSRASDRINEAIQIVNEGDAGEGARLRALGQLLVNVADKEVDFLPLEAEFWLYAVRHREAMQKLALPRPQHDGIRPMIENALRRRGRDKDVSADAVSTIVRALFQGLVRQRRLHPDSVPEELFGQALHWLFTGIEAGGSHGAPAGQPEPPA
jgi:AcrR family transcriptional regulator